MLKSGNAFMGQAVPSIDNMRIGWHDIILKTTSKDSNIAFWEKPSNKMLCELVRTNVLVGGALLVATNTYGSHHNRLPIAEPCVKPGSSYTGRHPSPLRRHGYRVPPPPHRLHLSLTASELHEGERSGLFTTACAAVINDPASEHIDKAADRTRVRTWLRTNAARRGIACSHRVPSGCLTTKRRHRPQC